MKRDDDVFVVISIEMKAAQLLEQCDVYLHNGFALKVLYRFKLCKHFEKWFNCAFNNFDHDL